MVRPESKMGSASPRGRGDAWVEPPTPWDIAIAKKRIKLMKPLVAEFLNTVKNKPHLVEGLDADHIADALQKYLQRWGFNVEVFVDNGDIPRSNAQIALAITFKYILSEGGRPEPIAAWVCQIYGWSPSELKGLDDMLEPGYVWIKLWGE